MERGSGNCYYRQPVPGRGAWRATLPCRTRQQRIYLSRTWFRSNFFESRTITDCMVLDSAYALEEYTAANHLEGGGHVYPPIKELQEVSIRVASRVIKCAINEGVAEKEDLEGHDLDAYLRARFWHPRYLPLV